VTDSNLAFGKNNAHVAQHLCINGRREGREQCRGVRLAYDFRFSNSLKTYIIHVPLRKSFSMNKTEMKFKTTQLSLNWWGHCRNAFAFTGREASSLFNPSLKYTLSTENGEETSANWDEMLRYSRTCQAWCVKSVTQSTIRNLIQRWNPSQDKQPAAMLISPLTTIFVQKVKWVQSTRGKCI